MPRKTTSTTAAPAPLLALHDIHFSRENRPILSNINWSVAPSQIAAILGPNGSGKSTLLRIISGYLWPQQGSVQLLGQTFGETPIAPLRARLGILEATTIYPFDDHMTAHDVVTTGYFSSLTLGYLPPPHPTPEERAHARHSLDQVGLASHADQLYLTLSTGERLRCLLARALVRKPDLLLLDEPTAGLDLPARETLLATLSRLHKNSVCHDQGTVCHAQGRAPEHVPGETSPPRAPRNPAPNSSFTVDRSSFPPPPAIITITHHLEELLPRTSNILLLSPTGTPIASGPPEAVLTNAHLSAAYNVPVHVTRRNHRYTAHVDPQTWDNLL